MPDSRLDSPPRSDPHADVDLLNARDSRRWVELAQRGDFAGAWALSDRIRRRNAGRPCGHWPRHDQYIWDGSPIDGRRVLVRCYRGLGDTIQFVRYAALLRERAREVILWAQPPLLPLLERAAGVDRLIPVHEGEPDVAWDVDVEMMELPYLFRTTLATVPACVPYLNAEPAVLPGVRPRVGLVWRAGERDPRRTIPFRALEPLLDAAPVSWISLQCNPGASERHDRLQAVEGCNTPHGTARLMRGLDLVISADTMTAHLAGALGVRTWTLLPSAADWRWLQHRHDPPWYPTMRLFRQRAEGDWDSVVEEVQAALQRLI